MAYITGTVDEELLLRREYLSAENRILVQQLQGRLRLTDAVWSKNPSEPISRKTPAF